MGQTQSNTTLHPSANVQAPTSPKKSSTTTGSTVLIAPKFIGGSSELLTPELALELRRELPATERMHEEWILLYSSVKMGTSIKQFTERCLNRGPTLIIIKDTYGSVFGAFVSQDWKRCSHFYGDGNCFLFTIKPKFQVFHSSNHNQNYMYFNEGSEFNEYNGLGMGGRVNFFCLSLDKSFACGTSRPGLLTFNNSPCLCTDVSELENAPDDIDQYHFVVDQIEVWGFPLSESQLLDLRFKENQKQARVAATKGDDADYFILESAGLVGEGSNYNIDKKPKK